MAEPANVVPGLRGMLEPLDAVHPDPRNPNVHPLESVRAIRASMEEHGQDQPIVARRQTGRIIKGNGRYLAARQLGWSEVAVLWVEEGELEAVRRGLADHGSERLGWLDEEALREALREAGHEERHVAGFDPAMLAAALDAAGGEDDEDGEGLDPAERSVVLYLTADDHRRAEPLLTEAMAVAGTDDRGVAVLRAARVWLDATSSTTTGGEDSDGE